MKGDFTRFTFDPARHYRRVLQQQGRVVLDADWTEQGAIQRYQLRALAMDLAGPAWAAGDGFSMLPERATSLPEKPGDWPLSAGHFYVDGMLCENNSEHATLASQPYAPTPDDSAEQSAPGFAGRQAPCVLWLDVWERHLSSVEAPDIGDVALGGADTASRAQVVWQLRVFDPIRVRKWLDDILTALRTRLLAASRVGDDTAVIDRQIVDAENLRIALLDMGNASDDRSEGDPALACRVLDARASCALPCLRATLQMGATGTDPRVIAVDSGYRGRENRLYRVEIHRGGPAASDGIQGATFKWSRDNGSAVFAVVGCGAPTTDDCVQVTVTVANPGREARLGLAVSDWVELLDDDYTLAQRDTFPLLQVVALSTGAPDSSVTLRVPDGRMPYLPNADPQRHPLLRRWDQRGAADAADVLDVVEGCPITLEAGIDVTFEPGGLYAHGDYWMIPARVTGGGTLDWPQETGADGQPRRDDYGHPIAAAVPAAGRHHRAVLGRVDASGGYHEYCHRVDSRRR